MYPSCYSNALSILLMRTCYNVRLIFLPGPLQIITNNNVKQIPQHLINKQLLFSCLEIYINSWWCDPYMHPDRRNGNAHANHGSGHWIFVAMGTLCGHMNWWRHRCMRGYVCRDVRDRYFVTCIHGNWGSRITIIQHVIRNMWKLNMLK